MSELSNKYIVPRLTGSRQACELTYGVTISVRNWIEVRSMGCYDYSISGCHREKGATPHANTPILSQCSTGFESDEGRRSDLLHCRAADAALKSDAPFQPQCPCEQFRQRTDKLPIDKHLLPIMLETRSYRLFPDNTSLLRLKPTC